jgi:hypothetical protein
MKRLLLATVFALAAITSTSALETGQSVKFLWPDAIGCTHFDDTRAGVFFSVRNGRRFRQMFIDEVNDLGEKGRGCSFMLMTSEYRVVDSNAGGTGLIEYFCVTQPSWNSCLWVHLPGGALNR